MTLAENDPPWLEYQRRRFMRPDAWRYVKCHTCGTLDPGTLLGNFVGDHQPPYALNPRQRPQRFYPQCKYCSVTQGGMIKRLKFGR